MLILMSLAGIAIALVVAAVAWHIGAFLDCLVCGEVPQNFVFGFIACEIAGFASLIWWITCVM